MRKGLSVSGCVLFLMIILLPSGVIFFDCFGYTLQLANYTAFAIVTALSAMCTVALGIIMREAVEGKAAAVLFALTPPVSLINAAFYLFARSTASVAVSMLICVCCCVYLSARYGKPMALKITAFVIAAFMILPLAFFGALALLLGDFGETTVVRSVESPNGAYHARVIDSDQGALGGDTFVDVYTDKCIDLLICKITKQSQRVYRGNWGEYENMEIYWKDDHCLVINAIEYMIG